MGGVGPAEEGVEQRPLEPKSSPVLGKVTGCGSSFSVALIHVQVGRVGIEAAEHPLLSGEMRNHSSASPGSTQTKWPLVIRNGPLKKKNAAF